MTEPSSTITVRMPLSLRERLIKMARDEHRNKSNMLLVLILEALEARARRAEEA